MLQAIREKVTGWIAYGIILLISVPFALWGVNSYLGGGEVPPAATVNDEEISVRDLDRAYANYRQRLSQLFGGNIPESFDNEEILRQQVLDQLIEEFALRQYTDKQRYRIGDDELNRIIREMDVFQRDGKFDSGIYQAQLRSLGYSALGFEQELRRNGSIEQFQNGIRATAFVTPALEKQFTSLNNQTRNIRMVTFSVDPTTIQVDTGEIESHYQSQSARYNIPEKIQIDYIELSLDGIKQGIVVREDDIVARYQENQAAYTSTEVREASHILIKVNDDAAVDQALAKITEIRGRIVNGEDFADLAAEFSEDPGSANNGGNLGDIEPGVMVQTFEAALYSMQIDQLSEPVKTAFGWHLIKLHAISGGDTQSFESLRSGLENEIKSELAEGQIYDLIENLANLTYEQSDSLLPAAEQLELSVQTSAWFDRTSGEGIAADSKIRQSAFSPEVLQQGLNSEAIELGNDLVVFIRVNQRKPATLQPLEQVQETVKSELVQLKIRELGLSEGLQALSDLESGTTLADLAQRWSSSITDFGFVERNQSEVDAAVLARAFSMPKPEQKLVYDGISLGEKYAIIELSAVLSNDANSDQKALDGLVESLGGSEYQSTLKLLTSRASVTKTPAGDL